MLISDPLRSLSGPEARVFADYARRRREREPVAYITGVHGFRFLELLVDRRVLIPRPETEHVVEAALGLPAGARVVDVGTGSGAIALALKHERPDLEVFGTDIARRSTSRAGTRRGSSSTSASSMATCWRGWTWTQSSRTRRTSSRARC